MSEPAPISPEALLAYIRSLEARINNSTQATNNLSSAKEPKAPNPEKFSGKMTEAKNFVATCRDIFVLQPSRFPDEKTKIIYVGTNLIGNALTWYRNVRTEHERTPNPGLSNVESFFQLLLDTFEDPNAINNARDQLSRIKQGKESCLNYSTRFRNMAVETGYNEVAKVALFRNGLNNDLKDALANVQSLPEKFEDFVKLAITMDNRQYQRRIEHQRSKPRSFEPMQLDNITVNQLNNPKAPLSTEERNMRMKNGLCLYCGERGHLVKQCPRKPKNDQPRQESRMA